ncbi:MAG: hypothetical protein MK165_19235 [Pirellulaceae bacterium]|nr:hypothetical protein [Pirellulaceae bacterium]
MLHFKSTNPCRTLIITLWILGGIDLVAAIPVVMPRTWMEIGHELVGLGTLPEGPIVGYAIRTVSLMYVLRGCLLIYLSFQVTRYWNLLHWFGVLAVLHGVVVLGIDLVEDLPTWWQCFEGVSFSLTGVAILVTQRLVRPPRISDRR